MARASGRRRPIFPISPEDVSDAPASESAQWGGVIAVVGAIRQAKTRRQVQGLLAILEAKARHMLKQVESGIHANPSPIKSGFWERLGALVGYYAPSPVTTDFGQTGEDVYYGPTEDIESHFGAQAAKKFTSGFTDGYREAGGIAFWE